MYAEIAINRPVQGTFHYHIPAELAGKLQPGHLVRISFGTAEETGIVVAVHDSSPVPQTKPVLERLDTRPVLEPVHIEVARWLSEQTLAPLGACLWLFLPPGIVGRSDVLVAPTGSPGRPDDAALASLDDPAQQLLSLLQRRGALYGRQLNQAMKARDWPRAAEALRLRGLAVIDPVLTPPGVGPSKVKVARLAIPAEQVEAVAPRLGRESRRANVLEVLLASPDAHPTVASVCLAAGCGEQVLRDMAASGDVILTPPRRWLELARPNDQVRALLDAGEFSRAPAQAALLGALLDAGGALPVESAAVSSSIASALAEKGLVRREDQPASVSLAPRYLRADGLPDHAVITAALITFRGGQKALDVLRLLARDDAAVEVQWITAQTDADLPLLRDLAEEGLLLLGEDDRWRDPLAGHDFSPTAAPRFTSDQAVAWARLRAYMEGLSWEGLSPVPDEPHVFLLQGVTGSGKTELYLRAVEYMLAQGRGAIILVPEIALTPQTVRRFAARFPGLVTVVHGDLSPGERYDTWRRARSGDLRVIVGTRSALFTPVPDLGLVVLDEEHDGSYKHDPPLPPPNYHARDVAVELTRRARGVVILGSATPSLESVYQAQRGVYQRIVLPNRVIGHRRRVLEPAEGGQPARYDPGDPGEMQIMALPPVDVVDMRAELKAGNTSMFSRALHSALTDALNRDEQAILFLNRRGTASYVFCRDCGYVAKCTRCDTPLTYHREGEALRCHHCGHREAAPTVCPQCRGRRIKHFGAGTEAVQQALNEQCPGARSIRWDRDTASHHRAHEVILTRFADREAEVLIGTQMIAKGLDLPGVTLVGVLNADVGLALPDFRAAERTFQLLTQVVGRAGRSLTGGRGLIQSYQPEHAAIQAAARHDYAAFYAREIAARRDLGYPPLRRLARLLIRHLKPTAAQQEAGRAAAMLRARIRELALDDTTLIGPAPCFFGKLEGYYRWHVIVRSPDPVEPFRGLDLRPGWHLDIDPQEVL